MVATTEAATTTTTASPSTAAVTTEAPTTTQPPTTTTAGAPTTTTAGAPTTTTAGTPTTTTAGAPTTTTAGATTTTQGPPATTTVGTTTAAAVAAIVSARLTDAGQNFVNENTQLSLEVDDISSVDCAMLEFGDSKKLLLGDASCVSDASGMTVQSLPKSSNTIPITHKFATKGNFEISVQVWNSKNRISTTRSVSVASKGEECSFPKVTIQGLGNTADASRKIPVYKSHTFIAELSITCDPIRPASMTWTVEAYPKVGSGVVAFSASDTLESKMDAYTLSAGLYRVTFKAFPVGLPTLTTTAEAFLTIERSPLEAVISGGSRRTVPEDTDLNLDASKSRDLDVSSGDQGLTYTWDCMKDGGSSITADDTTAWAAGTPCFASQSTTELFAASTSNTVKILSTQLSAPPPDPSGSKTSYLMRLTVSKDTRTMSTLQRIDVISANSESILIGCLANCGDLIIVNKQLKLEATCSSCASPREALDYTWHIFQQEASGQYKEVENSELWTTTGLTGRYLATKEEVFKPGEHYRIELKNGDASVQYDFKANRPPTGGSFHADVYVGYGLETEFTFSCDGWSDPDVTEGVSFFRYDFMYRHVGDDTFASPTPLTSTQGTKTTTKPQLLTNGLQDFDYDVEIYVTITDEHGSSAKAMLTIQVKEIRVSAEDLLSGGKLDSLIVSKDTNAFFTFVSGADNLVSKDEDAYNAADNNQELTDQHDAMVSAREEMVNMVAVVVTGVGLHSTQSVRLASQTVENIASRPDTLSDTAKSVIVNILGSILDSQLKLSDDASAKEKQEVSTTILDSMASVLNASKTEPCPGPVPVTADVSPAEFEELQAKAKADAERACQELREKSLSVNGQLQPMLAKITQVTAQGLVPGEGYNFSSPDMNVQIKMKESSDLANTMVELADGSFELPDLTNELKTENSAIQQTEMTKSNFPYDDKLKSPSVIGLTVSDDAGNEVSLKNLKDPIRLTLANSKDKVVAPQNIVYKKDTVEPIYNMYYHEVRVNETGIVLAVIVTPLDSIRGYTYYIGIGTQPNETDYVATGTLPKSKYNDERDWTFFFDTKEVTFDANRTVYIGLFPQNFTTGNVTFNITVFSPSCLYYDELTKTWTEEGITVSDETSVTETVCKSSHLTVFASNWFVPPNTIDFSTVFDNGVEKLLENIHVFVTMIAILVLYVALVILLRRYDKADVAKWSVAPLSDNMAEDTYHYHMTVHTGMRSGGGTESNVFFMLGGEQDNSEVRKLEDTLNRPLKRGTVNNYLLSVQEPLGSLMYLRIWHDNSGKSDKASWFLDRVVLRDMQTNEVFVFLAQRWLAVDKEDGQLEVMLPAATEKDLANFQFLFSSTTRQDMSDGHLWFSLLSRPTRSRFTRVQRLSCCLALLFATMIANAMWYKAGDAEKTQVVRLGPFSFTPQQVFISISSSVISVPISIIIVTFFRKAGPKPVKRKKLLRRTSKLKYVTSTPRGPPASSGKSPEKAFMGEELDEIFDLSDNPNPTIHAAPDDGASEKKKKKKKPFLLPWWFTYIAWFLVALVVVVSGTFTMLYSFEWGGEKSSEWLTAFVLSFLQSIVVIQPIKVLGIAVVIALIVKKPKVEAEAGDDEEIDNELYEAHATTIMSGPRTRLPSHRSPYQHQVLDTSHLDKMREERAKEVKMWVILKEIISYLFYILIISALTYDNKDTRSFRSKEELSSIFVDGEFGKVNSMAQFWTWTEKTLVPRLYADQWYNNESVHWRVKNFIEDKTYYRIGAPRLRLARVKKDSCKVQKDMRQLIPRCFDSYGLLTHDDADYGVGWAEIGNASLSNRTGDTNDAWVYRDTLELDGVPILGNIDSYSGGGYVAELGTTPKEAYDVMKALKEHMWLDRRTRAVFVEFNLFNPNTNLFSVVNLIMEFPATGGVVPYPLIQTLRLYNYVGGRAIFRLFLDIIFVAFTIYFLVTEVRKIKVQRKSYFRSFWNIMEVLSIGGSFAAFALYAVHYAFTNLTMNKFHKNKDKFTNFQYILNWDDIFGYVLGFLVFISMIKLLKLLRFNKKVTELMSTLDVATKPLLGFFVFFTIIYVAFAQFCLMVFGRLLQNYSTFISTLESLFAMMLMNFHYEELQRANSVLGPLFFLTYVVILAFVIINVLVSILDESYNLVKSREMLNSTDYEMVDYILKQFKTVLSVGSGSSALTKKDIKSDETKVAARPQVIVQPVATERRDTMPKIRYDAWQSKKTNKKKDVGFDVYDNLSRMPSAMGQFDPKNKHFPYETKF